MMPSPLGVAAQLPVLQQQHIYACTMQLPSPRLRPLSCLPFMQPLSTESTQPPKKHAYWICPGASPQTDTTRASVFQCSNPIRGCRLLGHLAISAPWLCLHHLLGMAKSRRHCPCREPTRSWDAWVAPDSWTQFKTCFSTSCKAPPCSQQGIICLAATSATISFVECLGGAFCGECSLGVYPGHPLANMCTSGT